MQCFGRKLDKENSREPAEFTTLFKGLINFVSLLSIIFNILFLVFNFLLYCNTNISLFDMYTLAIYVFRHV